MPELPEVETVVRTLRPRLVGHTITAARLLRPDIVTPADVDLPALLPGKRVAAIDRRGKRIVIALDTGERFYVHLGMTGQLTAEPPDAPLRNHTHLVIHTTAPQHFSTDAFEIRFRDPRRFGGVWWLGRDRSPDHRIGPEPLSLTPRQLSKQLATTTRAIKTALLDQQLIAGLGNIYVDEALFAARIHPLTPAKALTPPQLSTLNRAIKQTLRTAIRHRGSTLRDYVDADGATGGFQLRHKVYDRTGDPCRACKTPIERLVLAGRSTHFCPSCQRK